MDTQGRERRVPLSCPGPPVGETNSHFLFFYLPPRPDIATATTLPSHVVLHKGRPNQHRAMP